MLDSTYCAVIPVYRHEHTVEAVAREIIKKGYPVFLVDDGNTPDAKKILEEITQKIPGITLISYAQNGGKGYAVTQGLEAAHKAGFEYALQIDADGQHDLGGLEFFVKASKKHPGNLISGFPQYDASVPKSRENGRKITNFWTFIETLSFDIPDAMCGFRVYPIKQTLSVIRKLSNLRMGFDIEILVKLKWKGLEMNFYPIQVTYPKNGISNFRMVEDNISISWMHTKLFFGMLLRLPVLLARKHRKNG
jgi:Glycosyltransferases involved in cell wall biogenesis